MTSNYLDELPDDIRRHFERRGIEINAWEEDEGYAATLSESPLPHLIGVLQLLREAGATLRLFDLLSSDIIPIEQPAGWDLPSPIQIPSGDPEVEWNGLVFENETWPEMRTAIWEGMTRALWGYALVKFCAALPKPPKKPSKLQKEAWEFKLTELWLDANRDNRRVRPLYEVYWRIRNTRISHRGPSGAQTVGIPRRYRIATNDGTEIDNRTLKADPELHFDPEPDDLFYLNALISNALIFVLNEQSRLTP